MSTPRKKSKVSPPSSPDERISFARAAFRDDLFVFAKACLGYDRLYEVHRPWCRRAEGLLRGYLNREPGYTRRAMTLEPRGTYKSTILDVAFSLWALVQNPNLRILLYSSKAGNAEAFLSEISKHILGNARFRAAFGAWNDPGARWNMSGITIAPRTEHRKEASITAMGRDSEMTSQHYDIAIVDDLVVRDDRDSYAEREKSKAALKDLEAIMEPESLVHVIGTHWHYDDAYSWVKGELNPALAEQGKGVWDIQTGDVYLEDGETPRFPEIIPDLEALKIQRGLVDFYSNYRNRPLPPDSQLFPEEALQLFKYDQSKYRGQRAVAYWDPASTKAGKGKDPDYHAIPVLALHPDGYADLIDVWMRQDKPSVGYNACERLARDYALAELRVETNHLPDAADNLTDRFRKKGIATGVTGVKATGAKTARIETLEPLVSSGRIRFREDWRTCSPSYRLLVEQLTMYPVASHDDGPDALEGAYNTLIRSVAAALYEGEVEEGEGDEFTDEDIHEIESIWR
jgi:predicted phage terminase large subunit-like protein